MLCTFKMTRYDFPFLSFNIHIRFKLLFILIKAVNISQND